MEETGEPGCVVVLWWLAVIANNNSSSEYTISGSQTDYVKYFFSKTRPATKASRQLARQYMHVASWP